MDYQIRRALPDDLHALHGLMTELATLEGYIDRFAVTPETVFEAGFRKEPPDFIALVAESGEHRLVGMAVTYLIPFTFMARPTLVVKELYVSEPARNSGLGEAIMRAVATLALELNCFSIRWQVAPWNEGGRRFYERLGAVIDDEWLNYELNEDACRALASNAEPRDRTS